METYKYDIVVVSEDGDEFTEATVEIDSNASVVHASNIIRNLLTYGVNQIIIRRMDGV